MTLLLKGSLSRQLQQLQAAGRGACWRTFLFHPGGLRSTPCSGFNKGKQDQKLSWVNTGHQQIQFNSWQKSTQAEQRILKNDTHTDIQTVQVFLIWDFKGKNPNGSNMSTFDLALECKYRQGSHQKRHLALTSAWVEDCH